MAPADRGEPTSEQAAADARSRRSEATVAALASDVFRSLDRALRSRTRAMSAWSGRTTGCARVRAGRPSAAAEQADAEPATGC